MKGKSLFSALAVGLLACSLAFDAADFEHILGDTDDFVSLSLIQLEEHEDTPTPPFSVCKYLLETAAKNVQGTDSWADMAKHIGNVRATLPPHVRTACDSFIKQNQEGIVSLLQVSGSGLDAELEAMASLDASTQVSSDPSSNEGEAAATPADDAGAAFQQFWNEKGQYCGACLTMTKKIQKWLSMNCTQDVITERLMRMCNTMPSEIRGVCNGNRLWVREFVVKQLLNRFPIPNHCAYIGLCEKTMVVRSLQNPMIAMDRQNALIQDLEGSEPNLVQESEPVFQRAHETVNTAPEITFNLDNGGVSYRDVDRSMGDDLPKIYMDGTPEGTTSLLQQDSVWDLDNPDDPHITVHAQDADKVHVPIMHATLKEQGATTVQKTYNFQDKKLPIDDQWLKGCASCQFTIGGLFEFMSNPRTARTILPAVKKACTHCNSAEEVQKCQDFVEHHGVAFYQDVVRQGSPSKWCPRLELCEIQYFYPSPHVLPDSYEKIRAKVTAVSDF